MEIKRENIERVIITGTLDEYKSAQAFCEQEGFQIVQINPCLFDDRTGDTPLFELVAERVFSGP